MRNKYLYAIMVWVEETCYIYIGTTFNITRRSCNHRSSLRRGKHHNSELQKLYDDGHNLQFTKLYGFDGYSERKTIEIFSRESWFKVMNVMMNSDIDHTQRMRDLAYCSSKRIEVSKDGNLIGVFESAKQAAKCLNLDPSDLTKVARGVHKRTKGYTARYVSKQPIDRA